jgi:hypothetical protein
METLRGRFDSSCFSLFKISDAFENEMAKKVKLQNILSQLRKCVDHPYLFDGKPVPFLVLFFVNSSVVRIIENIFKRMFQFVVHMGSHDFPQVGLRL